MPVWLAISLGFSAVSFAIYASTLRRRLQGERAILLYQLSSAALFTLIVGVWSCLDEAWGLEAFVGSVALHCIYSLSFLELWSLAEGGYSLAILREIDRASRAGEAVRFDTLHSIGEQKRAGRLESLAIKRLVKQRDGICALTGAGRAVASGLRIFRVLANLRDIG
jgi:hypothetical protein